MSIGFTQTHRLLALLMLWLSSIVLGLEGAIAQSGLHPNADSTAWLKTGKSAFAKAEWQEARRAFSAVISLDSLHQEAYSLRGRCDFFLKDTVAAMRDLTRAITLNPNDEQAYFHRGLLQLGQGKWIAALADMIRAEKAYPESPERVLYQYYQGLLYTKVGDDSAAVTAFGQVLIQRPRFHDAALERGNAYFRLSQFQSAISDYTLAFELHPLGETAYLIGLAHYRLGHFDHAETQLTIALGVEPDERIYFQRALSRIRLKRYFPALDDLDSVITLSPRHAGAFFYRGSTKSELGLSKDACKDFFKARVLGYPGAETLFEAHCGQSSFLTSTEMPRYDSEEYVVAAVRPSNPESLALTKRITKVGFQVISNTSVSLTTGTGGALPRLRQNESFVLTPGECNAFMLKTSRTGQLTLPCVSLLLRQEAARLNDEMVTTISNEIHQLIQEYEFLGMNSGQDVTFGRRREILAEVQSHLRRIETHLKTTY